MDKTEIGRRALVKAATAAGLTSMLPAAAFAQAKQVAGYDPKLSPTAQTLNGWLQQLHKFGPIRATGTKQCRDFEEWLAAEFAKIGCLVERDQFKLMAWECDIKDCSIEIKEDGGATRKLEVIAYYPFGGSTAGKPAATGRMIHIGDGSGAGAEATAKINAAIATIPAAELANSIVVIDMPVAKGGIRGIVEYAPDGFYPNPPVKPTTAPRVASQGGQAPMAALENKCKGLILCYTDVSDESARYNYLPFSDQHRKIPAVWVGKASSDYLKSVSGKATATVRCDAKLTPNARADTIVATLPGKSDEVVFVTTQTDGPNECNENGALGVLAVATYWSKVKDRPRTMFFSLPTGHYAAGAVRDAVTGSGRSAGTSGVIAKWPKMAEKAVGQLSLEQLGAMEWADEGMKWQPLNRPSPMHWIPTPAAKDSSSKIIMASTVGEDPKFSRVGIPVAGQAPGEGGAMRSRGVPGAGLMGSPHYFFRCDPKGVIDKLDARVMKVETDMAIKMTVLMQRLSVAQLKGTSPITDKDLFG